MSVNKIENKDAVDTLIDQWRTEGFTSAELVAMETIGRIKRLEVMLMRILTANYKQHDGLTHWEFDVLATLRRASKPYCLSPTALFDSMMVSSGTMTNRLQNLEKRQLVKRVNNPKDKRSLLVELTSQGIELIDRVMVSHVQLENELVDGMSTEELHILNLLMKKLENQLPEL